MTRMLHTGLFHLGVKQIWNNKGHRILGALGPHELGLEMTYSSSRLENDD